MAFIGKAGKKYGLIVKPSKAAEMAKESLPKEATIFGEESSDEEDQNFKKMEFDMKKEAWKAKMKKETQLDIEKALKEDASVFQYDEVYDDISNQRRQKIEENKKAIDRKPKYIGNLLKTAASRKLDLELLQERKVQQEREAENDQFSDKEAFVTASFKAKMAELKALQEKQQAEELEEERLDVTKMGNMNGFYRYMINEQTKGSKTSDNMDQKDIKTVKEEPQQLETKGSEKEKDVSSQANATKRQYRTRRSSKSSSESSASSDIEIEKTNSAANNHASEQIGQSSSHLIKTEKSVDSSDLPIQSDSKKESDSAECVEVNDNESHPKDTEYVKPKPSRRKLTNEEVHEGVMKRFARKSTDEQIETAKHRYFLRKRTRRGPFIETDSD